MREDPNVRETAPQENVPPLPVPAPASGTSADSAPPPVAGPIHPEVPGEDTTPQPVNEWMQDA
jgi:hypothetical protein